MIIDLEQRIIAAINSPATPETIPDNNPDCIPVGVGGDLLVWIRPGNDYQISNYVEYYVDGVRVRVTYTLTDGDKIEEIDLILNGQAA